MWGAVLWECTVVQTQDASPRAAGICPALDGNSSLVPESEKRSGDRLRREPGIHLEAEEPRGLPRRAAIQPVRKQERRPHGGEDHCREEESAAHQKAGYAERDVRQGLGHQSPHSFANKDTHNTDGFGVHT